MPRFAGQGYEFVPVGEIVRPGDDRWHRVNGRWALAVNVDGTHRVRVAHLYRRSTLNQVGTGLYRLQGGHFVYRVESTEDGRVLLKSTCGNAEVILSNEEFRGMSFERFQETVCTVDEDLLDDFAMSALTGLLASGYWQTKITDGALPIAENAWKIAKAMMQTRGKNHAN